MINCRAPFCPLRFWRSSLGWVNSVVCSGLLGPLAAAAQPVEPVTLHYIQRPPYMMASGDGLVGLTGGPSYQAFRQAKVPVVLKETPFARQLYYLEKNLGKDCMIGLFRKPEREAFGKYTKPVYQDRPQIILTASAHAARFAGFQSVVDVFNDKNMVLFVKLAYSYGVPLDAMIEKYQPTRIKTADENLQMIKAVLLKPASYMFMAPEEAAVAIEAAGYTHKDFTRIQFSNMPEGEYRHLFCSRNVPDDVIQKLNAAIKFTK